MEPLIPDAGFFPTLVFDPETASARTIGAELAERGLSVYVAQSMEGALRSSRKTYFRVVFVAADLANEDCLRFLDAMRQGAPTSWLIVSNADVNSALTRAVYRHGGDALLKTPVNVRDLAERISAFQSRSRPVW